MAARATPQPAPPPPRRSIGHHVEWLEEVGSTNSWLLESPERMGRHGLVAVAAHQTAGRGRVGRRWASLPGRQLQFSVVLHPRVPPEQVPALSLMLGLAVADAAAALLPCRPELKWPNDVLLNGSKFCGILAEMERGPGGAPRVAAGIGINVLGTPEDFPVELRGVLTTLAHETGQAVDMEALLRRVLAEIERGLGRMEGGELAAILTGWQGRARLTGRPVRFPSADGMRAGRTVGLTREGYLLIETPDGARHAHTSGELEWEEG